MCHSMMGLTGVYKTAVFTFIFAFFESQSIAEILLLPHLEKKTNERHMEILLPVSILNFLSSPACDSAVTNFVRTGQSLTEL